MIGIILLAASWLALKYEKKNLTVLGFNRPKRRSIEFSAGLIIAGAYASLQFILISHWSNFNWQLNTDYSLYNALESLRWNINSVLFEEFIFRGYLLYKAIQLLGERWGCFLSAIAFGVYHWFSYGVIGSIVPMVYVFLLTGTFGLMLAYAFAKTGSIILPIALHLGWNLVTILVFSNGPIGDQLLIKSTENVDLIEGYRSLIVSVLIPFSYPLLMLWLLIKNKRVRLSE